MNINTDNYEAYLLDYMEGNLGPDETEQLKAFVAAQGLDWDELTEDLPHLDAPQIAFENKERLKKKSAVVPLYVKIASAAAAAGLLLTVSLWPEKSLPKVEPITDLKPIEAYRITPETDLLKLPKRPTSFVKPVAVIKEEPIVFEKTNLPLMAKLEPIRASEIQVAQAMVTNDAPDFEWLTYKINNERTFAHFSDEDYNTFNEDVESLSLISRGLLWATNGQHDSFGSLINAGVSKAKQELSEAATDAALAAYYRVEEGFEETKEHWQEKLGE